MAMTFAKPQLMSWAGNRISDHNRSELSIAVERIENSKRMANGTMRKYIIADKRTFSTDWSMLPASWRNTVDGFWGAEDIETFYDSNPGVFDLVLNYTDREPERFKVVMSSFSKSLVKRGLYDFFEVSVELEEV